MPEEVTPTGTEASKRIEAASALFGERDLLSLALCAGGEPWAAVVYFVEDEPRQGALDMCCSILMSPQRRQVFEANPRVAFVVAGGDPERWFRGSGVAEIVADDADAQAIVKRLGEKTPRSGPFLDRVGSTPVRIHVEHLKMTDLDADPPVTEFTFA